MRPFMMPVFFYGGQISKALESPTLNTAQQVALTEIRSLMAWMLLQVRLAMAGPGRQGRAEIVGLWRWGVPSS